MASVKELNTYYTLCKIKINPTNYSLKDRVIVHNMKAAHFPSRMSKYRYVEYRLLDMLLNHFKTNLKRDLELEMFKPLSTSMYLNTLPNVIVDLGLYVNNLHINPICWNKLTTTTISKKLLDVDKALIYYLTALLKSENNLSKYIMFTNLEEFEHFKNVKDMSFLTDSMSQIISGKSNTLTLVDPSLFSAECNLNDIMPKGSKYEGCDLINLFLTNVQYLAEALFVLEHIEDADVKKMLHTFLQREMFFPMYYGNPDGSITYLGYIKDIIQTEDMSERYSKIRALVNNSDLKANIESYVKHCGTLKQLPLFLSLISGFAQNICTFYVRTTLTQLLMKLCRYYKLNIHKNMSGLDPSALKDLMDLLESPGDTDNSPSMISSLGDEYVDMEDEKENDSDKPESKDRKISEPTVDFLDAQNTTFTESGYDFNVSDDIYKLSEPSDVDTDAKIKYDIITSKVKLLNKNLIRKIKEIKVYNTGGKNSGMSKGKLDKKALHKYKSTDKIFYNNTYKVKESDLAFGIILDVSGSMHGKGIENGVTTLVVLHETLKALNINHSIITHESRGMYQCNIVKYHYFKEDKLYNVSKNYNLMNIRAMRGNCDSAALYYMEKAMTRVQNKDKIVMMFSDGEPTECKGDDLKKQVRRMERKGIKVIGIGINYPSIAEYYKDYANGANLKEMLDIVSNILKQYILEKKE